MARFATRDRFAAWNGTAPVEVSSGGRKTYRLSLRGNRRISDAIYARLVADARKAAAAPEDPGGQPGNDSGSSAAGSHPERRLFG